MRDSPLARAVASGTNVVDCPKPKTSRAVPRIHVLVLKTT
jgi:hypothetical protein